MPVKLTWNVMLVCYKLTFQLKTKIWCPENVFVLRKRGKMFRTFKTVKWEKFIYKTFLKLASIFEYY